MTDVLIFSMVIVVVVGVPLAAVLWRSRPRPGDTRLVLLGVAGGEAEAHLWTKALRDSGVWSHMRSVGDLATGDFTSVDGVARYAYQFEIWVRPKDEQRAREVLGL